MPARSRSAGRPVQVIRRDAIELAPQRRAATHAGAESSQTSVAPVLIHASQFPDNVRRDLVKSLRTRRLNHKFLYDGLKQTQKWLALHRAFAPSRTDADCARIYARSFEAAASELERGPVHLIGLGCGGGRKDARLLRALQTAGCRVSYAPCDVSVPMVLEARRSALRVIDARNCFPLVCDLASAKDLPDVFNPLSPPGAARLVSFFGMIPNFEPQTILPRLSRLVRRGDWLLFSANLVPEDNYAAGVEKILPQYENEPTRDWLMTFLSDLGFEARDGKLRFAVEAGRLGLRRIVARFWFQEPRRLEAAGEAFNFRAGDSLQVFFSYRYTPERVKTILARHGLAVCRQWIMNSGEEGVFLVRRMKLT